MYKVGPGSSYKWSYGAPVNRLVKWVTGVITITLTKYLQLAVAHLCILDDPSTFPLLEGW